MYVIRTENSKTNNRALVVSTKKWNKLQNIIAEKNDDITANNEINKLKNKRQAASKAIIESWATTTNQRRKEIEKKQKLLADIEAMKIKRDEDIKLNILERRNEIVEKMRMKKWSERDSTKATTRALHYMEVLRERGMQIKFNEAERIRITREECLQKIEQNLEAEQYKKDQLKETLKHAETKKANASFILKELKERENIRHNLNLQLRQEGEAELQKIAKEIEEDMKEKKAKIISEKEDKLKNLNANRENVAKKNELHKLEEDEENMVVSIIDGAKKKMSKIRKYKEIQLLKEKQLISEKIAEKAYNNKVQKINASDREYQDTINEKEQRYIKDELRKKELAEKRKKDFNDLKKKFDEESQKEKERLKLSSEWESKRNETDTKMLINLRELSCRKKIDEMNQFREQLDIQCNNNIMANMADKQEELKQYDVIKKLWRQDDKEFMTCINKLIDKYKKAKISVVPLLKTIENYEKNKLL